MLKLSDNPPILSPKAAALTELAGRWWVAHTKARAEKALAWDMLHRGIGYFLPMVEQTRFSGGRKRRVMLPLFPSYVFFCGDEKDRLAALMTHRVCRTLEVVDQQGLVADLAVIEKALAGRAELDPYPYAAVGQRCRITAGPFRGIEGIVVERTATARLVLEVAFLGRGVVMEIDAGLVEPVG